MTDLTPTLTATASDPKIQAFVEQLDDTHQAFIILLATFDDGRLTQSNDKLIQVCRADYVGFERLFFVKYRTLPHYALCRKIKGFRDLKMWLGISLTHIFADICCVLCLTALFLLVTLARQLHETAPEINWLLMVFLCLIFLFAYLVASMVVFVRKAYYNRFYDKVFNIKPSPTSPTGYTYFVQKDFIHQMQNDYWQKIGQWAGEYGLELDSTLTTNTKTADNDTNNTPA